MVVVAVCGYGSGSWLEGEFGDDIVAVMVMVSMTSLHIHNHLS